ncbi:hypothetical protein E2562_018210 [Oryza meyeriana var. granulata]|uniref:Uncharacterized protein n=1 Tax=Oryza meyeriana var. granulata TaxID=110450 RepID=A0A6G1CGK6_9ORYZ|nr:hypothetical protein E2562_018210 [Oryza meyeriana var. granulata]
MARAGLRLARAGCKPLFGPVVTWGRGEDGSVQGERADLGVGRRMPQRPRSSARQSEGGGGLSSAPAGAVHNARHGSACVALARMRYSHGDDGCPTFGVTWLARSGNGIAQGHAFVIGMARAPA